MSSSEAPQSRRVERRKILSLRLAIAPQRMEGAKLLESLLAEIGGAEAQLRIVLTRGGRRILLIEALPERGASVRLATVTYSPTVILNGVKSLSYGGNMQATRIAQKIRTA